jgi:FixJ family two-component response regulator
MSGSPVVAIIDDDAAVGRATGSLVRSLGLAVRSFPSAEQFLAAPDRDDVACIITDVQMPGMSGIDLYCELQARGAAVPFIFITAFSEARVRQRAGDDARILRKPFDGHVLAQWVEAACGQQ